MWVEHFEVHVSVVCWQSAQNSLHISPWKMAGAQVFAFSLFLILTVHGSEVGKLS